MILSIPQEVTQKRFCCAGSFVHSINKRVGGNIILLFDRLWKRRLWAILRILLFTTKSIENRHARNKNHCKDDKLTFTGLASRYVNAEKKLVVRNELYRVPTCLLPLQLQPPAHTPPLELTDHDRLVKLSIAIRDPLQLFANTVRNELFATAQPVPSLGCEDFWLMVRRRWNAAGPDSPEQTIHRRKYEALVAIRQAKRLCDKRAAKKALTDESSLKKSRLAIVNQPRTHRNASSASTSSPPVPMTLSLMDIDDSDAARCPPDPIVSLMDMDDDPVGTDVAVYNDDAPPHRSSLDVVDDGTLSFAIASSVAGTSSTVKSMRDNAQQPLVRLPSIEALMVRGGDDQEPDASSSRSFTLLSLLCAPTEIAPSVMGRFFEDPRDQLANVPLSLQSLQHTIFRQGERALYRNGKQQPRCGYERRALDFQERCDCVRGGVGWWGCVGGGGRGLIANKP